MIMNDEEKENERPPQDEEWDTEPPPSDIVNKAEDEDQIEQRDEEE
jgi:hypothetical protein